MNAFSLAGRAIAIHLLMLFTSPPPAAEPPTTSVLTIELPAELPAYKDAPGVALAQGLCTTCHSADYTSSQPPMPRKFWEATVKKMKDKFGAPLPDDTAALVDYLVTAYGVK